jgi:hypothetical protein
VAHSRFSRISLCLLLGLVALATSIGTRASAQEVSCEHIRECSTLSHKYELASHVCQAELASNHCAEANRNTEYGQYLRDCSPETMCREAKFFAVPKSVVMGCTKGARDVGSAVWDGLKVCHDLGPVNCPVVYFTQAVPKVLKGIFVDPFVELYDVASGKGPSLAETNRLISKARICLNFEGNFRIDCEVIGGTFARATMYRSIAAGLRGAAASVTRDAPSVAARRVTVVERARENAGLFSRTARAPVALIRDRARKPVLVAAANELARPTKAKPATTAGNEISAPVRAVEATRREAYMQRLLGHQNTTVEQLAFRAEPTGNTVFLDIQNSKMKYMNDHLKDKNLVTAVTNARLKTMFDELHAKYPNLAGQTIEYDDFKSGRFGFKFTDGKIPPGFLGDLRRTMNEAEEKFIAELGEFDVVPKDSNLLPPEKWFASGTGLTADEANLACRYAARTCQSNVNFRDSQVLKNLGGRLTQSETVRGGVMKILRNTNLTERLANGQVIPRLEVFEVYRKATSPADFARRLQESTGQSITASSAQSIMNYLKSVDEWSTGLLIVEERQSVTFAGSKHNGVTIDVSGMGALNLRELAAAMAGETDVMSAMPKARAAERSATEIFERNKAAIVEAARASLRAKGIEADIRVSGDDIIVLPTNRALDSEALAALHEAVATSPSSSNVRISAVSAGAAGADTLAVSGESLEKAVRVTTAQTVSEQARYTLMVVTDAKGQPRLRVAARSGPVPADVEDAYQSAFRAVLQAK